MKNIIKIAVLLLALLMIVPCLAACNKNTATTDDGGTRPPIEQDDPYLQQVGDLERYNYTAFVRSDKSGNGGFKCEDFWVDPETGGGDALSFAVKERNATIEDEYNCKIEQVWSTQQDMFVEMRGIFNTHTNYELTIMVATEAANCATAGYLSNFMNEQNSLYINLDNEAFDQNSVAELTLAGNLYYVSGDMNISTLDNTIATIFNTKEYEAMAEELAVDFQDDDFKSPYTMVQEGKWTIENMLKIAGKYTLDADTNDGDLSYDKGDKIGFYEYIATPLYYYYGSGLRISENFDGLPQFTIHSDEAGEVYNYLYDNLNLGLTGIPGGAAGDRAKNFLSGQVLFADFLLYDTRKTLYPAKIDWAYGILPIPTYEENEEHHSVVFFQNTTHLWALPYYRADNVKAAKMFYVMTVYSGMDDSTLDAYYVRTMYMEVAKDDGSRASLDIIRDCLVYDIALLYSSLNRWGKFHELLSGIDSSGQKQFTTYTSPSNMDDARKDMENTIADFVKWGTDY